MMNNKPEIIRALERQKLDSFFSNQLWKLIGSVTVPLLVYFVLWQHTHSDDMWIMIAVVFVALAFYIGAFAFLVRVNNQHIKSSQQLLVGKAYQRLSVNEQRLTDSLLQLFVSYQQVLQKLLKDRQEHRIMFRSPQRNRIMKDWWADVTSQSGDFSDAVKTYFVDWAEDLFVSRHSDSQLYSFSKASQHVNVVSRVSVHINDSAKLVSTKITNQLSLVIVPANHDLTLCFLIDDQQVVGCRFLIENSQSKRVEGLVGMLFNNGCLKR